MKRFKRPLQSNTNTRNIGIWHHTTYRLQLRTHGEMRIPRWAVDGGPASEIGVELDGLPQATRAATAWMPWAVLAAMRRWQAPWPAQEMPLGREIIHLKRRKTSHGLGQSRWNGAPWVRGVWCHEDWCRLVKFTRIYRLAVCCATIGCYIWGPMADMRSHLRARMHGVASWLTK